MNNQITIGGVTLYTTWSSRAQTGPKRRKNPRVSPLYEITGEIPRKARVCHRPMVLDLQIGLDGFMDQNIGLLDLNARKPYVQASYVVIIDEPDAHSLLKARNDHEISEDHNPGLKETYRLTVPFVVRLQSLDSADKFRTVILPADYIDTNKDLVVRFRERRHFIGSYGRTNIEVDFVIE